MSKLRRFFNLKNLAMRRTLLTGGAFVLGFVVLGVISVQAWEYTNSVSFCADTCHDVHAEEPEAFQDSFHARVKCTECHMGRLGTLSSIAVKTTHFRHGPAVLLGQYGRPTKSESMRPANESCERCHWPPAFHGDTVREIIHYASDEKNTEKRTYLILKTGAGEREGGLGFGIHWHITNPVEYIATDEHKQEIRWVRATLPDGRMVEYSDVTNPMSSAEFAEAEVKVVDCVDCHNRVGHPFPYPEKATDDAIAEGRLSRDLPFARKEMVELLSASYPDQQAALAEIESVKAQYKAAYPEVAANDAAEIEQAAELAEDLFKRLVFEKPGISWESFPDNGKHKEFAGCFRCHDGKHVSPEGESIRLHCNICHSIPVTVGEGDRPPQMPLVSVDEPASHLAANFMADHRFQADDSCVTCHGEVSFGSDDSSFCANSACHGQPWPEVELDAAFTHPIELTGAHAEAMCHDCHAGEKKPEFKCVNCHEPPVQPHFGETCEDCHVPEGFKPAEIVGFQHPVPLKGNHATLDCLACHGAGLDLVYECAACHQPPTQPHFGERCEDCHNPEGFKPAEVAGFQHPVPLEGNHATLDCLACHSGGLDLEYECATCHQPPTQPHFGERCEDCHNPEGFKPVEMAGFQHPVPLEGEHATLDCLACHSAGLDLVYECAACHQPQENHFEATCDTCHSPQGWAESVTFLVAQAPEIPHMLEGLSQCLLCHNPDGRSVSPPADHDGYSEEQCTLCHKTTP